MLPRQHGEIIGELDSHCLLPVRTSGNRDFPCRAIFRSPAQAGAVRNPPSGSGQECNHCGPCQQLLRMTQTGRMQHPGSGSRSMPEADPAGHASLPPGHAAAPGGRVHGEVCPPRGGREYLQRRDSSHRSEIAFLHMRKSVLSRAAAVGFFAALIMFLLKRLALSLLPQKLHSGDQGPGTEAGSWRFAGNQVNSASFAARACMAHWLGFMARPSDAGPGSRAR